MGSVEELGQLVPINGVRVDSDRQPPAVTVMR